MSGRTKTGASPTRYAGLNVQTSSLGLVIPLGWGTFRIKANVVWYANFKSKPIKAASSGKGGSQTTGYSYSADVILGICEGPIAAIGRVYKDATALSSPAAAGLSFAYGAIGQAPWAYLETADPTQAIGYSGLAICYASNYALDDSAALASHSFEIISTTLVAGLPDANPAAILTDWFTNARYGVPCWPADALADLSDYANYCLAANLLLSPVIDTERQASDFLKEILQASNSDCLWSEGQLKVIPYGDTEITANGVTWTPNLIPVYALDDDSYLVKSDDDDPITVDIEDQSDAYNIVQIDYLSRSAAYNSGLKIAQDAANIAEYGRRKQNPISLHSICDDQVAMNAAQLILQRTLYVRRQYKFSLPWTYDLLEPMDIIELNDPVLGLTNCPARIVQIDEDEDGVLAVTAEDMLVGISHAPLYAHQDSVSAMPDREVDPGGVEANLALYSEDATGSAWTRLNLSITANAANDQYGLATADAIVPSTADAEHTLFQAVPALAGLNYTYSVCLQAGARRKVRVAVTDAGSWVNGAAFDFDLSAGVMVTQPFAFGTGLVVSAGQTAGLTSGIWRLWITVQIPGASLIHVGVSVLSDAAGANPAASASAIAWAGDGSAAVYVSQQALRQGVSPGVYAATGAQLAGPVLFNPPAVLTGGAHQAWAAVAGGPQWGGCNVWTSIDGTNYDQEGVINGPARFGAATTAFAAGSDPDTTDTLGVDLGASAGALAGASEAAADASSTLCLIDQELISFSTASLTAPSRYGLSAYIRRGVLNSAISAHAAGAVFVRLDEAVFQLPYLATQQGQTVYVKFQSFNLWGRGLQSLADCNPYPVVPVPLGAAAPVSTAWTAVGATISNNGVAFPIIRITGACDNPSATGIVFLYRVTGSGAWISSGVQPPSTTVYEISGLTPATYYDVAVAYIAGGVEGQLHGLGSIESGGFSSGAISDGTVLYSSSVAGAWSYAAPPGYPLAHVEIQITGADGGDKWANAGGSIEILAYGGAGGIADYAGVPASAGSTFSGVLGAVGADGGYDQATTISDGGASTCVSPAMTAGGGAHAGVSGGAGGAATGGTTNTTGAAGGATGRNGSVLIIART